MHNDIQDRDEWRRERSLLALGHAIRGEDDATAQERAPSDAMAPAARHRAARERREALSRMEPAASEPQSWPVPAQEKDDFARQGADAPNRPARRGPWRLLAATTILGALLGAAVGFSLPSRYQATAELTLGGGEPARLSDAAFDSRLRMLTSGMVLTRVVDRLNLDEDPEFNGNENAGGGIVGLLRAVLMPGEAQTGAGHRQALAVDRLAADLTVSRKGPGNAIAVTATTANGEKSALIANAVADVFVETYRQGRRGTAADTARDTAADRAFSSAAKALEEFARKHKLGDPAENQAQIAGILRMDGELASARAHTEALKAKVAALRATGVDSIAGGLPQEFETAALQALRTQYLDIKRQADRVSQKLGPRNPERRAVEAQLDGARNRLSAELGRIAASRKNDLRKAVEAEQALAARLADTGLDDEAVDRLRQLQRAFAAAQVDRQTVTASIAASAESTERQAHVVSRASPPDGPSGPPRTILTLAGALLGLFGGVGIATLRGNDTRTTAAPEAFQPQEPETSLPSFDRTDDAEHAEPYLLETAMYPVYPDHAFAQQPQLSNDPWQREAAPAMPQEAYHPYMATPLPATAYPAQPTYPQQPAYPQAWQPAPPAPALAYYYQPAYGQPARTAPFHPPQSLPAIDAGRNPMDNYSALEEIRASLQEFREALRDLAESRSRRRIF